MGDIKTRFTLEGEQKFKSAMSGAANAIKVLNSEQKLAKAQFQNTGDAEKYAAQQADILKKKIEQQKIAVKAAEQALKQMAENGVDASSKQFQQWEMKLNSARTSLVNMETELNNVGASMTTASGKAEVFSTSLDSINKKVSFDAVIKGVDAITGGLETVAQKAKQVGESIWDNIVNSAKWADDAATLAHVYEIPLQKYLQLEAMVASGMDTTVDAIVGSMSKLKKNVGGGSTATMEALKSLGLVVTQYGGKTAEGIDKLVTEDAEDLFFRAGKAILSMEDAFDKEATAQAIFGKSWRELIPLFTEFQDKETFNTALEGMNTNTDEAVENLADLNDQLGGLKHDFDVLKNEVLSGLAPALTEASKVLSGLLERLNEYLKSPEGQKALADMGDAVSGLFEDLKNIDPEDVVNSFVTLFTKLVDSFEWISKNWEGVKAGLFAIVGVITAGKTISALTTVINAINALKSLGSGGTPTPTPSPTTEPTTQPTTQPVQRNTDTDNHGPKIPFDPYSLVPLAILGAGTAPALIAQGQSIEQIRKTQKELEEAAEALKEAGSENAEFVERSAAATGLVKDANGNEAKNILGQSYTQMSDEYGDLLMGLKYRRNAEMAKLVYMLQGYTTLGNDAWNQLNRYWNGNDLDPMEVNDLLNVVTQALKNGRGIDIQGAGLTGPQTEEELSDASGDISQASTDLEEAAKVLEEMPEKTAEAIKNVKVVVTGWPSGGGGGSVYTLGSENVGLFGRLGFHANGLFSVPWDGYPAILHKGERVLPAREAASPNYSSNLYVENMNMNGGVDAAGLAAAMAAAQRRTMSGYGS